MMGAPLDEMDWLPTDDVSLDEAAMAYARAGFRVLPVWGVRHAKDGTPRCTCGRTACSTHGKHPIGNGWQKKASADPDVVRDARRSRPDANIGLAMGGPDRLVAVDIDGEPGRVSWAALEAAAGQTAPLTLTSRSGRADGGEHRLFRVPAHLDMKRLGNRASFRHSGIDTRIDAGQIVVAPSMHASGSRYTWTVRAPIADLPEWLFEALAMPLPQRAVAPPPAPPVSRPAGRLLDFTRSYIEKALENAAADIAAAGSGERNHKLFAKACTIFEYYAGEGIDHVPAWNALADAGRACGLPSEEVGVTLSKAWGRASQNPKRVPAMAPRTPTSSSSSAHAPATELPAEDVDPAWEADLDRNAEGLLKKNLGNIITVLGRDPRWRGCIAWDAFAEAVVTTRPPPVRPGDLPQSHTSGEWTEEDTVRTVAWLSTEFGLDVAPHVVEQAITAVARKHVVHPVLDYLSGLTWDGTPRLDTFLTTHFGADDSAYVRGVSSRWMISAVARAFRPGCQADCTLVLESPEQGLGKSTGLAALVPERGWFADTGIHVGDKDSYQALRSKWIYELGELSALKGRDLERVKGFLSSSKDNYRPSYGRRNRDFPRQVIFCASTNESQYLVDRTGNRRFWPVAVTRVDRDAIVRDRDQLWAEAVHRFQEGEAWHVNTAEFRALCETEQADRVHDHPWLEMIEKWLERPWVSSFDSTDGRTKSEVADVNQGLTTTQVLLGALRKRPNEISRGDETMAGEAMLELGWVKVRGRIGGGRKQFRYFPPDSPMAEWVRSRARPGASEVGPGFARVGPCSPEQSPLLGRVGQPGQPESAPAPCELTDTGTLKNNGEVSTPVGPVSPPYLSNEYVSEMGGLTPLGQPGANPGPTSAPVATPSSPAQVEAAPEPALARASFFARLAQVAAEPEPPRAPPEAAPPAREPPPDDEPGFFDDLLAPDEP